MKHKFKKLVIATAIIANCAALAYAATPPEKAIQFEQDIRSLFLEDPDPDGPYCICGCDESATKAACLACMVACGWTGSIQDYLRDLAHCTDLPACADPP